MDEKKRNLELRIKEAEINFQEYFCRQSRFIQMLNPTSSVSDFINMIERDCSQVLKDGYLFDIRKTFLCSVLRENFDFSKYLDELIRQLLPKNFPLQDYLQIMLIGKSLWRSLIEINKLISKLLNSESQNSFLLLNEIDLNRFGLYERLRIYIRNYFIHIKGIFDPATGGSKI